MLFQGAGHGFVRVEFVVGWFWFVCVLFWDRRYLFSYALVWAGL